jgi:hypothetical protein
MPRFPGFVWGTVLLVSLQAAPPLSIEQQFSQLRKSPPELYAFLLRMPKGGDLHNHLAGATYAESLIGAAAQSGFCIDKRNMAIVRACTTANQCSNRYVFHA